MAGRISRLGDWELLKVRFRWCDDTVVVDRGDGVYLRNDVAFLYFSGTSCDSSRLVFRLRHLLNGTRPLEEIARGLTRGNRQSLLRLVELFVDKGFIRIEETRARTENVPLFVDSRRLADACAARLAEVGVETTLRPFHDDAPGGAKPASVVGHAGAPIVYLSRHVDSTRFARSCAAATERYRRALVGGVQSVCGYIGLLADVDVGGCWNCWQLWLREHADVLAAPSAGVPVGERRQLATEFVASRLCLELVGSSGPATLRSRARVLLFDAETMNLSDHEIDAHPLCSRCAAPGSRSAVEALSALAGLEFADTRRERLPRNVPTVAGERIKSFVGVWRSLNDDHLLQTPLFRSEVRAAVWNEAAGTFAEVACLGSGLTLAEARWRALLSGLEAYLSGHVVAGDGTRGNSCDSSRSSVVGIAPYMIELPSMRLEPRASIDEAAVHWGPMKVGRSFEGMFEDALSASLVSLIQAHFSEIPPSALGRVDVDDAAEKPDARLLLAFFENTPIVYSVANVLGIPVLVSVRDDRSPGIVACGGTLGDAVRELLRQIVQLEQSVRCGEASDPGLVLLRHAKLPAARQVVVPSIEAATPGSIYRALTACGASVLLRVGPTMKVGSAVYRSGMVGCRGCPSAYFRNGARVDSPG